MNIFEVLYSIKSKVGLIKSSLIYKHSFKEFGYSSRIIKPLRIIHSEYMTIEKNVCIDSYAYLIATTDLVRQPQFIIREGTKIGNFNHISCAKKLEIGKSVLTADRVYISDNFHQYNDINLPIIRQSIGSKGEVYVGDNTWIGDGVCIISCRVGKNCVIGANSVVLDDIPDYSVAVGAPAKVVKRYSFETNRWEKC